MGSLALSPVIAVLLLEALRLILLCTPVLLLLIGILVSTFGVGEIVVVLASLRLLSLVILLAGRCRCATIAKVLVKDDKVVGLGRVRPQIEVLAKEAEQLVRGFVIGILVCWQVLVFHHVFEDTKADTLPLQRLMHIEVKDASWINLLLLSAACDEE